MEDKKIKIINSFFLVITILFAIYTVQFINELQYFFYNMDIEVSILGIGSKLYLIGFIILVIEKILKKESKVGAIMLLITTIINIISVIMFCVLYEYKQVIDIDLIVIYIIQKLILASIVILNIKEKESNIMSIILVVSTAILNLVMAFHYYNYIYYLILIVVNLYMALYLFYTNRGTTEKTFRTIIIAIVATVIVLSVCVFSACGAPKIKNNVIESQLEAIESIDDSMIPTKTKNYKYENFLINYKVSNNMQDLGNHSYVYNNNIVISIFQMSAEKENKDSKRFNVNGREYKFAESDTDSAVAVYTKIKNNSYLVIMIAFQGDIELTQRDLQNLKPFFEITIR